MADKPSFTPGPWRSWPHNRSQMPGHSHGVSAEGSVRCDVADVIALDGARWESEGNARLISAAPDLLLALQAITPHAIGHSKPDCKGRKRDPENCEVCKAIWAARDAIAKATETEPQL
jgi:hypothetical protein